MTKLIVTDMDGTLLQKDLSISPRTIQAIRRLQETGILFTLASGRPDQLMKEYVDQLGLEVPIITSNGSVIGHPFEPTRLVERGLDEIALKRALDILDNEQRTYMIYTKDAIFCKENDRSRFFEARNQRLPERQRAVFRYADRPATLLDGELVTKILIIEDDPVIYQDLDRRMRELPDVSVIQSQDRYIDLNPQGIHKGEAVATLAAHYGIDLSDVIAFGDHHNDIEMLQTVGTGVAMANAVEPLKAVADAIAPPHEDDGVARWLEASGLLD
jgi:Cof subfamily protein (haloacid dehalogenase superfamily)